MRALFFCFVLFVFLFVFSVISITFFSQKKKKKKKRIYNSPRNFFQTEITYFTCRQGHVNAESYIEHEKYDKDVTKIQVGTRPSGLRAGKSIVEGVMSGPAGQWDAERDLRWHISSVIGELT